MTARTALLASVVICIALPTKAASITNNDGKDYKLTIVEGGASSVQPLKSGDVLHGVCLKGCIVRLGDSPNDDYELEGADAVSIEDGLLYSDGADGAPGSANAGKSPAAKP